MLYGASPSSRIVTKYHDVDTPVTKHRDVDTPVTKYRDVDVPVTKYKDVQVEVTKGARDAVEAIRFPLPSSKNTEVNTHRRENHTKSNAAKKDVQPKSIPVIPL